MTQRFPVAYSPGMASDLAAMAGFPATPGQTTMAAQARTLIGRLDGGAMLGTPLPTLGDPALEGCRIATFETPASRAQRHGRGELIYQLHPAVQYERAPLVVHIVATAHVTDDRSGRWLRGAAAARLSPGDGRLALAYSSGVRGDIEALTGDPAERAAILAAVNGLAVPGGPDWSAGEDLWVADRQDLRGYRHTIVRPTLDGRSLPPVSVVHRMLPPAGQSRINVVQIAAAGPRNDPAVLTAAAIRLKRAAVPPPALSRTSAAAARSTTGTPPRPRTAAFAPQAVAPRRPLTAYEREARRNGL